MVGAVRFELTTLWSQTRCATRLRYAPTRTAVIYIDFNKLKRNSISLIKISCY